MNSEGYRVAVAGAWSLLGQELLRVLQERRFPVARLITFEAGEEELEVPVVDLGDVLAAERARGEVSPAELDFIFLAARSRPASEESSYLHAALDAVAQGTAGRGDAGAPASRCVVIDLVEALATPAGEAPGTVLSIPFLERTARPSSRTAARLFVAAHPAAIVLGGLLLRLAARFPLKSAVAQVFFPVSELGARAIEELQKQTVNLLSFQKIPQNVFGAQLAFNLLSNLGGKHAQEFSDLERRIRQQLHRYLGDRAPLPSLRLTQVPVFYSLAVSLYVETVKVVSPEAMGAALSGERIRMRRHGEPAPSQVEAAGSSDILVGTVAPDSEHACGVWIWAVVDNIRLAAENAVEIAESLGRSEP